jgi:hypothetical protein
MLVRRYRENYVCSCLIARMQDKIIINLSKMFANLKYLGMTVTIQNYIHEEIKSILNSGNI